MSQHPADEVSATIIPTRWVGPIRITGDLDESVEVPLATYETPLWPSVGRGARVSRLVEDGIRVTIVDERMTRSVLLTADNAEAAHTAARMIDARFAELEQVVRGQSNYARLLEAHSEIVGNLLFVRFAFSTGDASGHNMVT